MKNLLTITKADQIEINNKIKAGDSVYMMVEGEECKIGEVYKNGDGNVSYTFLGKNKQRDASEFTEIYFESKEA
jgi:hypothetical protein